MKIVREMTFFKSEKSEGDKLKEKKRREKLTISCSKQRASSLQLMAASVINILIEK